MSNLNVAVTPYIDYILGFILMVGNGFINDDYYFYLNPLSKDVLYESKKDVR